MASDWPLGWFATRRSGRFAKGPRPTLSLPAPALPSVVSSELTLRLAAWRHGGAWGHELSAEFRLLRDFRSGDPARAVHWPSSLRHRNLLARESEPPPFRSGRFGVLLHSLQTAPSPDSPRGLVTPEDFEVLLRMASGLLRKLRGAGVVVAWRHFPGPARILKSRRDFDAELDRLSVAARYGVRDIGDLVAAARALEACTDHIILSDTPREAWESTLRTSLASAHCLDLRSFAPAARLLAAAG